MKLTRIFALLLALTMALCVLAACGDGNESSGGESTSSGANTSGAGADTAPQEVQMPVKAVGHFDGDYALEVRYEGSKMTILYDGTSPYVEVELRPDGSAAKKEWKYDGTVRYLYEYGADGTLARRTSYDEDGSVKHVTEYDGSAEDKNEHEYEYEYDANGNLTKKTRSYEDGDKAVSEYDADGNLTKYVHYFDNGVAHYYYTYKYGADGRLIEQDHCNSDGSVKRHYEYVYNADGRLEKRIPSTPSDDRYEANEIKGYYEITEYGAVALTEEQERVFWNFFLETAALDFPT